MKKTIVLRYAAIGMATLSMAGFAAAGSLTGIEGTGPNSFNRARVKNTNTVRHTNNNMITATNNNSQAAATGNANVNNNTFTGGLWDRDGRTGDGGRRDGVRTGDAINTSAQATEVAVDNHTSSNVFDGRVDGRGEGDVRIAGTGPNSENRVDVKKRNSLVSENNNAITVTNNNTQSAASGNANVTNNTRVGEVRTGDAINNSAQTTKIKVDNN